MVLSVKASFVAGIIICLTCFSPILLSAEAPAIQGDVLGYFSLGRFNSSRVQAFRLASLDSPDMNVAGEAIRGIALSDSTEKLRYLGAQLSRRDPSLVDVVEGLSTVAMNKDQMQPMLEQLESLTIELANYEGAGQISDTDIFRINRAINVIKEKYNTAL